MATSSSFMLTTVLILVLSWRSFALRDYVVIVDELKCTEQNNYIKSFACLIGNTSEYPVVNVDVQMKKEVQEGFYDFFVYYAKRNKEFSPIFKENRIDWCDIPKRQSSVPIFQIFTEIMRRSGSFPNTCPIAADFHYKFENVTINTEYLPAYVPPIRFRANFAFYNKRELYFNITASGKPVYKKKRNKNQRQKRL